MVDRVAGDAADASDTTGRLDRPPAPPATTAGRPGWRRALQPVPLSMLSAALLCVLWCVAFPTVGTDLSAQLARADFAAAHPESAYDFNWYYGIVPAAYSVLSPYVFAVAGTRLAASVAAIGCAGLVAALYTRYRVPAPRAGALWTVAALFFGLLAGQATFTLGLLAGTAAVFIGTASAHQPGGRPVPAVWRLVVAALLAILSGLLSPVAALFVGLVGATLLIAGRRVEGIVLGAGAAVPLAGIAAVFGTIGVQPIFWAIGVASVPLCTGVYLLVPREWRVVRVGAVVYGLGVMAAWAAPTAVGSNVERFGLLTFGPVLAACWPYRRKWLIAGLVATTMWQVVQPLDDLYHGNAPVTKANTRALMHRLVVLRADTARVEAVPEYGHWEAEHLAETVPLARGWERQIDTIRNPLFYEGHLTAAKYRDWLRDNAVHYVAISRAPVDYAAEEEAAIVRSRPSWLVPVWHDRDWALYRVMGSEPLVDPPGRVVRTTAAKVVVRMSRPGTVVLRVHPSRFLRADHGARVGQAGTDGRWATLTAPRAGTYTVDARY